MMVKGEKIPSKVTFIYTTLVIQQEAAHTVKNKSDWIMQNFDDIPGQPQRYGKNVPTQKYQTYGKYTRENQHVWYFSV